MTNQSLKNLEKDVSRLKDEIKRLDFYMVDQEQNLKDLVNTTENIRDMGIIDLEKYHDCSNSNPSFSIELISIIIGLLSLLLAITILWINKSQIDANMKGVYIGLGLVFIVLFGIFVISWIWKNFPKIEGARYKRIISYIDSSIKSNNLDMTKYIDGKSVEMNDLIEANNSHIAGYINGEILKLKKYVNNKIKGK